ncbi:MAG: hypothetical protein FWC79_07195 [Oscillospiraceae bacterium]|nr:hypothetical protein [Oscillospiraceae bacterium]
MKKCVKTLVILILMILMLITLAGCGSDDASDNILVATFERESVNIENKDWGNVFQTRTVEVTFDSENRASIWTSIMIIEFEDEEIAVEAYNETKSDLSVYEDTVVIRSGTTVTITRAENVEDEIITREEVIEIFDEEGWTIKK